MRQTDKNNNKQRKLGGVETGEARWATRFPLELVPRLSHHRTKQAISSGLNGTRAGQTKRAQVGEVPTD